MRTCLSGRRVFFHGMSPEAIGSNTGVGQEERDMKAKCFYCGYVRDSAAHAENWQSMGSCMGSFMGLGPRGFPLPRVRPRHD